MLRNVSPSFPASSQCQVLCQQQMDFEALAPSSVRAERAFVFLFYKKVFSPFSGVRSFFLPLSPRPDTYFAADISFFWQAIFLGPLPPLPPLTAAGRLARPGGRAFPPLSPPLVPALLPLWVAKNASRDSSPPPSCRLEWNPFVQLNSGIFPREVRKAPFSHPPLRRSPKAGNWLGIPARTPPPRSLSLFFQIALSPRPSQSKMRYASGPHFFSSLLRAFS